MYKGDNGYVPPSTYDAMDGNVKNFTYIDHDVKPTIVVDPTPVDRQSVIDYREDIINRILSISASLCPYPYSHFVVRNEKTPVILWNEVMLRDAGLSLDRLRDLCVILENTQ